MAAQVAKVAVDFLRVGCDDRQMLLRSARVWDAQRSLLTLRRCAEEYREGCEELEPRAEGRKKFVTFSTDYVTKGSKAFLRTGLV